VWRLRNWWSSKDDRILPLPLEYPTPLPVPSLAVSAEFNQLSWLIYPQIYQTGYGRFRPNKSDDHSSCRYYRGGWHRSFPALIPIPINSKEKATQCAVTWSSLITVSCSVKFSRLLHPVGSGFVSQNPSPGYCSHNPYASMARRSITPPTT
jgi:hypothetical protein